MMRDTLSALRVNAERFRANFEALAAVGATPEGGVHRPAFGEAHRQARRWFLATAQEAGLDTRVDGAGNHSALLRCGPPGAKTLLLGSHLDSVPDGGRFDGALGVVAALESLQVVKEQNLSLNTHLEAIDFTDEEGHLANFVGSLGLTGRLTPEQLQQPRGGHERFQQVLQQAGLSNASLCSAGRDPNTLAGYLELHIEQGGRLAEAGVEIGIVTGIVGIRSFQVRFCGRADHAGTTPMGRRLDASQGASAFALSVRETMMKRFPDCVATVGNMVFAPGVFNVVPHQVAVSLEFRTEDETRLDEIEAELGHQAFFAAERFGLDLEVEGLDRTAPAPMEPRVQEAFVRACSALDLPHRFLPSGAGHDAQVLASVCPTGMIFVPSVDGFSHSSQEFTEWHDCVNGANVLLHAALLLGH